MSYCEAKDFGHYAPSISTPSPCHLRARFRLRTRGVFLFLPLPLRPTGWAKFGFFWFPSPPSPPFQETKLLSSYDVGFFRGALLPCSVTILLSYLILIFKFSKLSYLFYTIVY
jgi:hypothetical protein